ncbi:uncharacterized protein isoform X2 [Musca autumnalis]|uniref:uncharacterized protein isoform X2 n=1 Tax=Musca autumnalis TaxID=221902 RepID=UPI003CF47386
MVFTETLSRKYDLGNEASKLLQQPWGNDSPNSLKSPMTSMGVKILDIRSTQQNLKLTAFP